MARRRVGVYPSAGSGLPALVVSFEDGKVIRARAARSPIEIEQFEREERKLNAARSRLDARFSSGGQDA